MINLQQQIEELNKNLAEQLPLEVLETFSKSINDLKTKKIETHSTTTGEHFPNFSLKNTTDEIVHLKDVLKKGKVILTFFRGSWCPYCNLQIRALQTNLEQLTHHKITLLAISPQTVTHNAELKNTHSVHFDLLTDKDNLLAKELGIAFKLQDYVTPTYSELGIELSHYNENSTNELPVPAVYVINTDQTIHYKFVDTNYMNRINIEELIQQL